VPESALAAFRHPLARRLALVFAVVYFSQGMYYLPDQPLKFALKQHFGFSPSQIATLYAIIRFPWNIKPVYGLLSDFVPLFGRRRKSYLVLSSALASAAGFTLVALPEYSAIALGTLMTLMGLGLAFNDVLTDALMVENGRRLSLTGAFQSVQWAAINTASVLIGMVGGILAHHGLLRVAFLIAAIFPLLSLTMAIAAVDEPRVRGTAGQFRETWRAIRGALWSRDLWVVAGFILFWVFTPSIGTPLFFHQTDTLRFEQWFIGLLDSVTYASMIVGALAYGAVSRQWPLRRLLNVSIAIGVVATLVYLFYQGRTSAAVISGGYGAIYMFGTLAFLDLAAKACPRQAEGTFFALLMSVYNIGMSGSEFVGSWLFEQIGYSWLIIVSAAFSALCWFLVPLVRVEEIEARSAAGDPAERGAVSPA
jgi:MFS family permease